MERRKRRGKKKKKKKKKRLKEAGYKGYTTALATLWLSTGQTMVRQWPDNC